MIRAWYWKRFALGLVGSDLLDLGDSTCKRRTSNSQSAPWLWKWLNKPEVEGRFSDPPIKNSDRDRPCHVILIRCTCPRCHAMPRSSSCAWWWTVQCVSSGDSYKTENTDDGKAKSRDTRGRATNCEAGTRERSANLFIFVFPWRYRHLGFHVQYGQFFSPVTSHKPLFYIAQHACAHRTLDKAYVHVMRTGVHRPHPLA